MVWQNVLQCHSELHCNNWQDSGYQEGHKEGCEKKRCSCSKILQLSIPTSPSTSAQGHPNTVDHNVIQPPTAWPVYQPPPTESSLPVQPQHQPVTASSQYQLPVSQSSQHTHKYYQHPPIQSLHQYASTQSPIPHNSSLSQYSKHHQPHTADLDQQRQPPALTAKESFLKMLYSPNTHQQPAVLWNQSHTSTSEHETAQEWDSYADTLIIARDPIPEYGEPCFSLSESTEDRSRRQGRGWKISGQTAGCAVWYK